MVIRVMLKSSYYFMYICSFLLLLVYVYTRGGPVLLPDLESRGRQNTQVKRSGLHRVWLKTPVMGPEKEYKDGEYLYRDVP